MVRNNNVAKKSGSGFSRVPRPQLARKNIPVSRNEQGISRFFHGKILHKIFDSFTDNSSSGSSSDSDQPQIGSPDTRKTSADGFRSRTVGQNNIQHSAPKPNQRTKAGHCLYSLFQHDILLINPYFQFVQVLLL